MTDLEYIIQELKERRKQYQKKWDTEGRESFADRHICALDSQIKFMMKLDVNLLAQQKEEEIQAIIQRKREQETRHLMFDLRRLAKKNLNEIAYKKELNALIESHLKNKTYTNQIPCPLQSKPQIINATKSQFEEDKIYDLLEKVYEHRLTSFQIRKYQRNILNELVLEVTGNNDQIILNFLWDNTCHRSEPYARYLGSFLEKKLDFHFSEMTGIKIIKRNNLDFNKLVTEVSRILFEVMLAYEEVTIVYEEE